MKVYAYNIGLLLVGGLLICSSLAAQTTIWPPHWWAGMQNDTVELLLYNKAGFKKAPEKAGGLTVLSSKLAQNPRYAYVELYLKGAEAGRYSIGKGKSSVDFELKSRGGRQPAGLNPADVMYLITPDRFANGDPNNDRLKGMKEKKYGRDKPFGRHGGDIKGIHDHLEYINDLGCNSLWISPLLTNDQPEESYHGYAITDHYNIDPRFGSNAEFGQLMQRMGELKMKMVMDVVYNHVGTEHHLFQDLPDSAFFNWHKGKADGFLQTNYRAATLFDPHASEADLKRFADGWFVRHMPDVNQRNPHVKAFLIQNSIWWIEEFGIDAFRIDTYTYPDQEFMGELSASIKKEYPEFFIFGETWVHGPEIQSYFVDRNPFNPISTNMDAVTDFTLAFAIQEALNKEQGWNDGISKVYYRLAADYLYDRPDLLVTFLDNHDLARILGHYGDDVDKLKTALGMLFTLRGIPCMYYGTEVMLKETENHGVIREDFPGGWAGDEKNKFTANGRSEDENALFDFIQKLLEYRKDSEALTDGKLVQFIPENDIYVYFRSADNERVMVVVNSHPEKKKKVFLDRYVELWPKGSSGRDIISGESFSGESIELLPKSIRIIKMD